MLMMIKILMAIAIGVYPFAVYYGLQEFSPRLIGLCLFVLLALRLFFLRDKIKDQAKSLMLPTVVALLLSTWVIVQDSAAQLTLMPVIINTGFLLVFALSLVRPPSMIEVLARIQEPELSDHGVAYTRKVTIAWCGFFAFNIVVSYYTHHLGDMKIWTLYNGFIAYILMAVFFSIELVFRYFAKAKHQAESAEDQSR